ncbi:MAG: DUF1501 domain-containing protein [Planctomycetota bacterium]
MDASAALDRRRFLGAGGLGLGALALGGLLAAAAAAATRARGAPGPHHAPRAKSVIYLHMAGSPPPQDTFDHKPELVRRNGQACPERFVEGRRLAFIKGRPELLGSPHGFHRTEPTGLFVSDLLPHFDRIADRTTVVRSMTTEQFNHAPAQLFLHTGSPQVGGASIGAWAAYGLGALNRDLPAFVVMVSGGTDPSGGKSLWGAGFLPPQHQATRIRGEGAPVLYLDDPPGMSRRSRREVLDLVARLNAREFERSGDPETAARTAQYELAFRMQTSVPEAADLTSETPETRALYGVEGEGESFARNCLLARRLVERGVRFVQLYDWGWDLHGTGRQDDLLEMFPRKCRETDRAAAALVLDLDRRGLLDDTLVVWGGEFGRTPMREARGGSTYLGRDHHPDCFSIWLAGGGVKRGFVFGETDELGHDVVRDPVPVRDLQATILHLLGFDPERFRYPYQGLDQRLIGPAAGPRVRHELLA